MINFEEKGDLLMDFTFRKKPDISGHFILINAILHKAG
jgi:hypothetical protein